MAKRERREPPREEDSFEEMLSELREAGFHRTARRAEELERQIKELRRQLTNLLDMVLTDADEEE